MSNTKEHTDSGQHVERMKSPAENLISFVEEKCGFHIFNFLIEHACMLNVVNFKTHSSIGRCRHGRVIHFVPKLQTMDL